MIIKLQFSSSGLLYCTMTCLFR